MEQHQKVIIVTGTNKGLGYALVAKLIQQYLSYRIILTAHQGTALRKFLVQPLTEEKINAKLKEVEQIARVGKHYELASMSTIYASSKVFLNLYVRWVLAPKMKAGQTVVTIHPGWCKTKCSGQSGVKTAEEGIMTALYLIGLDNQKSRELNGKYLDDEANVIDY